jgi:hypothetical protein
MRHYLTLPALLAGLAIVGTALGCVSGGGTRVTGGGTRVTGGVVHQSENARVEIRFSARDREIIHDYYGEKRASLPPGLAKKSKLPPGLSRQVERSGHLPPGLERKRLPRDLEQRLSPVPEGHVRLRVGADVVLMDGRTELILDVMKDIAF